MVNICVFIQTVIQIVSTDTVDTVKGPSMTSSDTVSKSGEMNPTLNVKKILHEKYVKLEIIE